MLYFAETKTIILACERNQVSTFSIWIGVGSGLSITVVSQKCCVIGLNYDDETKHISKAFEYK